LTRGLAHRDFEKAVKLHPAEAEGHLNLGMLLGRLQDHASALWRLRTAARLGSRLAEERLRSQGIPCEGPEFI
jgi:Flp pilus assembly protein TadD